MFQNEPLQIFFSFTQKIATLFSKKTTKNIALWLVIPTIIYLIGFYVFNPHNWGQFSRGFFLDAGDGFQNVWNIWWVNKSVIGLGHHPWYTTFLEWPFGVNLIPQTMNAYNGFMDIPLFHLLHFSLVQAVNFAVVFSFVASGLTMFWLAYYLTRSYHAAIFGGLLYTFSSYHFAHAIGHLQLISMEWIPLFILAWLHLLKKPSFKIALGAAASLFLVTLCDYYYLFYSAMAAGLILLNFLFKKEIILSKRNLAIFGVFAISSLLTSGLFVYKLISLNSHDPLLGSHPTIDFGMDIFEPFIPSVASWYWHSAAMGYWHHIPGYVAETGIFLGFGLIGLLITALVGQRKLKISQDTTVWWLILGVFAALALGVKFRVWGNILPWQYTPYWLLSRIFPILAISGMPVRMFVIVLLAATIIASFVVKKINLRTWPGIAIFATLLIVFYFDVRPTSLPITPPDVPEYVWVLKKLPQKANTGIIDNAAESAQKSTYYQTIHEKPMAFGFLTRTPTSVSNKHFLIFADIEQGRQGSLCSFYHIRYFATRTYYTNGFKIIYQDPKTTIHIYDVKNSDNC